MIKLSQRLIIFTAYVLILLLLSSVSWGQVPGRSRVVYAELLGPGVLGSVNYDFRFSPGTEGLGMRIGVGMVPDVLIFPIEVNGLCGKKRLAFEYGLGGSAGLFLQEKPGDQTFSSGVDGLGFIWYGKAGMRLRPKNNGLMLNFNWTPMVNTEEVWIVWFGLGIGYSWNR